MSSCLDSKRCKGRAKTCPVASLLQFGHHHGSGAPKDVAPYFTAWGFPNAAPDLHLLRRPRLAGTGEVIKWQQKHVRNLRSLQQKAGVLGDQATKGCTQNWLGGMKSGVKGPRTREV